MTLNVEDWFKRARMRAAEGYLVVVRADGECLSLPALARNRVDPKLVATVERMIPSANRRNVAVISDTEWATDGLPSLQAASKAIPFFGMLMGFAAIGHLVWVFPGASNLLNAGCRDADVLIIDSASIPRLPSNWQVAAAGVMRNPQILIHDRVSYELRDLSSPLAGRRGHVAGGPGGGPPKP